MQMNASSIVNQKAEWEKLGVKLPAFDHAAMTAATKEHPIWVHFGAGNIFRGFIAALQQRLLNEGAADRGIIAADTFDYDIIDKIYTPYDNLTMNVTLNPDGTTSREIIGSVAEGLRANSADAEMMARFKQIFTDPSLQMISFTITEKGYALYRPDGSLMPVVQADIDEGPAHARHAMSMVASLLLERFQNGAYPLAVVSMDNCSHNGEKLQTSVMTVAKAWLEKGFVGQDFIDYLSDETKITFPWSMIDKITPRPHKIPHRHLQEHLHCRVRQRRAPAVSGRRGQVPQRPPRAGEGRCLHDRPRDRQQDRAHEGHHLPEPAAHRHERVRLHAGL